MAVEIRAAGLIIYRQLAIGKPFEYLLLQTSYGEHHWTPPKGHIDPGENERIAAVRETKEEAGLGPSDYDIVDEFAKTIIYDVKGRKKSVTYWLAKLKLLSTPVKLSDEHQALKWLNIDDACEFVKHLDMQSVLREAEKFLLKQ